MKELRISGPHHRNHTQTRIQSHLHCVRTNVSRRAEDHDGLAPFHLCVLEQHLPCGYRNYRSRSRLQKVQSLRLWRYHSRLRHCIFCLRSAELGIGDSIHLIPRANPHHVRPNRLYHPSQVRPQRQRGLRTHLALALADQRVPRGHSRGPNMDEDFTCACHRHRNVLQHHLVGAAKLLYTHSLHLASTSNIDDRSLSRERSPSSRFRISSETLLKTSS